MTLPLPIASSDFDILIGVIAAIGWVVMQIMGKASKTKTPPSTHMAGAAGPETPPENAGPLSDPAEELRRFFQRLEGARNSDDTPKTVPVAAEGPDRARRTTAGSQAVTSSGQAVTSSSQRTAARRGLEQQPPAIAATTDFSRVGVVEAAPAFAIDEMVITAGASAEAHAHEGRLAFVRRLRSKSDLRQAVAMLEVLSPPLAMRRTPFPVG